MGKDASQQRHQRITSPDAATGQRNWHEGYRWLPARRPNGNLTVPVACDIPMVVD
jgi:hypothetical protein